jgi:hypothetical protein
MEKLKSEYIKYNELVVIGEDIEEYKELCLEAYNINDINSVI